MPIGQLPPSNRRPAASAHDTARYGHVGLHAGLKAHVDRAGGPIWGGVGESVSDHLAEICGLEFLHFFTRYVALPALGIHAHCDSGLLSGFARLPGT